MRIAGRQAQGQRKKKLSFGNPPGPNQDYFTTLAAPGGGGGGGFSRRLAGPALGMPQTRPPPRCAADYPVGPKNATRLKKKRMPRIHNRQNLGLFSGTGQPRPKLICHNSRKPIRSQKYPPACQTKPAVVLGRRKLLGPPIVLDWFAAFA